MNPRTRPLFLACALVGALRATGQSQPGSGELDAIWNDPVFMKQFVAGYGFNAEVEPRISTSEIAILEKVRPLMAADLAKAEAMLADKRTPASSAILDFTLAGAQFQQDKLHEALENYQKAVGKFPSFRRAWRNLGLIHARKGNHDEAIRAFTRMIELGGADAYAFGLLGYCYAARQDFQPAEAAYRNALLLQPDNSEWRLGLTQCVFKQQKFEDAATLLDGLIARFPEKADFWRVQAHAYLGLKQPLKAAGNLEALDHLGKATADDLHGLGDIYVNENLLDLAGSAYRRAIDCDPKQPMTRALRAGEILAARGAVPQAAALAARIHELGEQTMAEADRRRLLKLDARLRMAEGAGSAETVAVLEQIVQADPTDGEALLLLGQYHARANESDRALLCYEHAASLEKFEVTARVRQAHLLVGLGRYGDAVPHLRRAQELKPRDDVARYLEQVERVAKTRR